MAAEGAMTAEVVLPPGDPSMSRRGGPTIRVAAAVSGTEWEVDQGAAGDHLTGGGLKEELERVAGVAADEQVLLVQHRELEDGEGVQAALSAAQAQALTLVRMPPVVVETTLSRLQAAAEELPALLRDLTLSVTADDAGQEAEEGGPPDGGPQRSQPPEGLQLPPLQLPLGLRVLTLRLDRDAAEACLAGLAAWRPHCLQDLHVEVEFMYPEVVAALAHWLGGLPDGLQRLRFGQPDRPSRPDARQAAMALFEDRELAPLLGSLPASLRSLCVDRLQPHCTAFRTADIGRLPSGLRSLHLHPRCDWTAEAVALLPPGLEVLGCAPTLFSKGDLADFMRLFAEGCRPRSLQEIRLLVRRHGGAFFLYAPDEEEVAAAAPPGLRACLEGARC